MFQLGSKVVVLASSTKANSSPRRGSIGYPFSSGKIYICNNNILVKRMEVMFTRYGYEEDQRKECKKVFVPIPLNRPDLSMKDLEDIVSTTGLKEQIAMQNDVNTDSIILLSLAPITPEKLQNDLINWILVHVLEEKTSNLFSRFIQASNIHPAFFAKASREVCEYMVDWAQSKENRISRIKDYLSSSNDSILIRTINMVKAIDGIRNQCQLNDSDNAQSLLFGLVDSLFNVTKSEQHLFSHNFGEINKVRADFTNIRSKLFSFSRSAVTGS